MQPSACDGQDPAVDLQDLANRCLGNLDLVARMLAKFEDTLDRDLELLEAAISSRDHEAAARVAHRLRGASANISAPRLRERAEGIEKLAREQCLVQLGPALEALRMERLRFTETVAHTRA